MRFLVTGGAGFIGSHLCERLLAGGDEVCCFDNFNDYYDPKIKRKNISASLDYEKFTLIEDDILNFNELISLFKKKSFDTVIHLAARAGVRPSINQPMLYQKVNVEGTVNILEACVNAGVKKIVMASSSSVYGKNKKVPFTETDSVDHPISPYAATKKACELIGYTYHALYKLPVTCLRFFTVYGPRQRPDMAISKFTRLIDEGQPIPVYGSGASRRDYTFYTDIIDGIEKAVENCQSYHIYNLGESQTIDLLSLIRLIESGLGKKALINKLPEQPGDVPVTFADITKAQKELKYRPSVKIEQGIKVFIEWYINNKTGK